jgi:ABC-type Mn2+/Zn2+ transport system permease subunit
MNSFIIILCKHGHLRIFFFFLVAFCCLWLRVRKMSKMTEKISKAMLNGVGIATGSVMKPLVKSQAGKAFLNMVPGEVLLASLDAVSKYFKCLISQRLKP